MTAQYFPIGLLPSARVPTTATDVVHRDGYVELYSSASVAVSHFESDEGINAFVLARVDTRGDFARAPYLKWVNTQAVHLGNC